MVENFYIHRAIQFVVATERENLADFVRRIVHEKRLSYREVAMLSGGIVSHTTVADVVAGKNKNPKSDTLRGLAKGLGVSLDELTQIASGRKNADRFVQFFGEGDELTEREKQIVLEIARAAIHALGKQRNSTVRKVEPSEEFEIEDAVLPVGGQVNAGEKPEKKKAS